MIITQREFNLIKGKKEGQNFKLAVDFGLREVGVMRQKEKAILDGKYTIDLTEKVKDNFCYQAEERLVPIAFFSENTNRFYKLVPTADWPTIALGSVPMHKLSSPKEDSYNKIRFLKPSGVALDTCMGLGYTAILAAKRAEKVITFERDDTVYMIAQINPISSELFSSSNIEIQRKDINLSIGKLKNDYFDCIIHDPPTFTLSPELYSVAFYRQLLRVLKPQGKMFHYTPLYRIKRGYDFPSKIKAKLKEAGFNVIAYSEEAGGFLCKK